MRHALSCLPLITILTIITSSATAGDLIPPGAPAPTMVDLETVAQTAQDPRAPITAIPVTIDSPGSYVVTQNLTHSADNGTPGIAITSSDVTLNLGGFQLTRSASASAGIQTMGNISNIVILNGTLRAWQNGGVDTTSANNVRIEGLLAHSNVGNGIAVGFNTVIANCLSTGNTGSGFETGEACTVRDCVARGNIQRGFQLGRGNTVTSSVARSSIDYGFSLGTATVARDCVALSGSDTGFFTLGSCSLEGCTAYDNAGKGFFFNAGTQAERCTAYQNGDDGFSTGSGSLLVRCEAALNGDSDADTGWGFEVGQGTELRGCTARSNWGGGIDTFQQATIRGCTVDDNNLVGIEVGSDCVIADNVVREHSDFDALTTWDGIFVIGSDNRIERNALSGNERGIRLEGGTNWVVQNHLVDQSDPISDAGFQNRVGALATDPTAAGPWANFN